jgi:DNA-binding IclR family transcriptional regulator
VGIHPLLALPLEAKLSDARVIKVLTKIVHVLDSLGSANGRAELTLVELAKQTKLPVSTLGRLLASLERYQFVQRDPETRRYRLGSRLIALGSDARDGLELRRVANPYMRELVADTQESAFLTIRDGDEGVYLDRVDSPHGIRLHGAIGARAPLHCGATRLVLLAFLPEPEQERFLSRPLARKTALTVTDRQVLRARLQETRRRGYAVSLGENTEGAAAVSVPVRDAGGQVVASLSAAGPVTRFTRARIPRLVEIVTRIAHRLSATLGYQGPPDGGPADLVSMARRAANGRNAAATRTRERSRIHRRH